MSITDREAMLREVESRGVDGVMSFACDPGVVTAAYVAEKLGPPSVDSFEAVSLLQNKGAEEGGRRSARGQNPYGGRARVRVRRA